MKSGIYRGKFLYAGTLGNNRPVWLGVAILVGAIKAVLISFQMDRETALVFRFF